MRKKHVEDDMKKDRDGDGEKGGKEVACTMERMLNGVKEKESWRKLTEQTLWRHFWLCVWFPLFLCLWFLSRVCLCSVAAAVAVFFIFCFPLTCILSSGGGKRFSTTAKQGLVQRSHRPSFSPFISVCLWAVGVYKPFDMWQGHTCFHCVYRNNVMQ